MKLMKRIFIYMVVLPILLLTACSVDANPSAAETTAAERNRTNDPVIAETVIPKPTIVPEETEEADLADEVKEVQTAVINTDWSGYFDGMNGAAVIYDPAQNHYLIYNEELADTRRSPCSTFKIISSLTGLQNGVIRPADSVHKWSGEVFWKEDWNKDLTFEEAFRSSCVWYFREVIDEIGPGLMQAELDKLQYGNCDISDWEGRANTNNNNRALTGFWVESSLLISPREQTQVMERIFGKQSEYSGQTLDQLKQVMRSAEQTDVSRVIYGKTGMGKAMGIVVDAWFTGFCDMDDRRVYFCVYLGESQGKDVSSAKAKEIAAKLLSAYDPYAM